MATVAPSTAGKIEVVEWPKPHEQTSSPCAVDITAGTFVRHNTSGKWVVATGASAAALSGAYFAPRSAKAGESLTGMKAGTFSGFTITQAYDAPLYVSDTGTLADAAGTAGGKIGRVIPGHSNVLTASPDKLVRIDIPESV